MHSRNGLSTPLLIAFAQVFVALVPASLVSLSAATEPARVVSWVASTHGPYPSGNAVAQPDLQNVLPGATADDQTFRLIVKPDVFGRFARLHFSNAFGSQPVTFDGVYVGLHASAGSLIPGTNRPVSFTGGKQSVTLEPGGTAYSDGVDLDFGGKDLTGRKLAVSFHIAGRSGPMPWHAKAMTTSYLSAPHSGSHGGEENNQAFPFTTTSWYFLDSVDVMGPCGAQATVAFGDSITDGTNSTINGDDRWPDFLSLRVHAKYGSQVAVVNAGIGGNQVIGPANYDPKKPSGGGPSALERLERDVLNLPGVTTVVWLEGINDLGSSGASAENIIDGFRKGVARLHERHIRVIGATITSSFRSTATHGTPDVDARRKAVNEFIRKSGVFDGVADFDAATLDTATGTLKAEFQPSSSTGGPGDRLHPNRAGYQAMANVIDLDLIGHSTCN
jgi:lysophospholipase L1-like esterase